MAGMLVGGAFAYLQGQTLFLILLLTALPMYLTGLAEDLVRHISTKIRYAASVLSALIAIWSLGIWIKSADSFIFDWIFVFPPFAILVTLFIVASYCHAFNLIDGLNGLASGTGVLIALGLAAIAIQIGQAEIVTMCLITVAAITGFFVFNFPFGAIFLGDGGAYVIGYMLTWIALVILHEAPNTSAWAMLLLFFWSLADTLVAIYRRRIRGVSLDTADRLHFHQMVLRGLEIYIFGRRKRAAVNPLATCVILPFVAAPVVTGVLLWNSPSLSFLALVMFGAAFVATYRLGIMAAKSHRRRPALNLPQSITPAGSVSQ